MGVRGGALRCGILRMASFLGVPSLETVAFEYIGFLEISLWVVSFETREIICLQSSWANLLETIFFGSRLEIGLPPNNVVRGVSFEQSSSNRRLRNASSELLCGGVCFEYSIPPCDDVSSVDMSLAFVVSSCSSIRRNKSMSES